VIRTDFPALRRRILWLGSGLVVLAALLVTLVIGLRTGLSLAAGGVLGAANVAWVGGTAEGLRLAEAERSRTRVLGGYLVRLVLILLALYATIRLHFLSAPAAVAGFAVFYCSIFVEGVLEALATFRR